MALGLAITAALFTGTALAANPGPASDISAEVWLGLFSTVIFALLAGYSRGLEKRLSGIEDSLTKRIRSLEHEDRQKAAAIALIRETVLREHPSRHETDQHRLHVETQLNAIRDRLDQISWPHYRAGDER